MGSDDARTDETLLRRALQDADAFALLYARYERPIVGFFVRAAGRGDLAADLTAETFAEALGSASRLGMPTLALDDELIERIEASVGDQPALELLATLPDDQRDALRARVIEERSYGEIAGELACSESVVRKRVSRALATLRARLKVRP